MLFPIQKTFTKRLISSCNSRKLSIAFPEGDDPRVLGASLELLRQNCVKKIAILGDFLSIRSTINTQVPNFPIDDSRLVWINRDYKDIEELAAQTYGDYLKKRNKPGTSEQIINWSKHPANQAAALIHNSIVDCALGGCRYTTAEIIRSAIQGVGLREGNRTISGAFAMVREQDSQLDQFMFSDCGVVIDPTTEQLVDIAKDTAETFKQLYPEEIVRVAFLSFSTKGSAEHPYVAKVAAASRIFKDRYPEITADGELQFDAAFLPEIAARKCPDSAIGGRANCFIFPNLDAGNLAYKITQRLAGFDAFGPILQGSAKPYSDLSRGASAYDIFIAALITMLRVKANS